MTNQIGNSPKRLIGLLFTLLTISLSAQEVSETWKELDKRGNELFMEEQYEDCLAVFIKSLAAAKKEFGINHSNYSTALYNVGIAQLYVGNYLESEKLLIDAAQIFGHNSGKNNAEYKSYVDGIVFYYQSIGDSIKILPYFEESRGIVKQLHGNKSEEHLSALAKLADLYLDAGIIPKAESLLLEGKSLAKGKDKFYGDFCTRLFQLYAEQGDEVNAEPFFKEAKRIRNRIQEAYWKTLDFKNMTYSYEIDDQDARLSYWNDQVKELKEADAESVEYARALYNLALIYQTQEDYIFAEPALMEAKEIIKKNGVESDRSTLYSNLAILYDNMGNFPLAKYYYEEQSKVARKVGGRDHINYGTACANQSIFYLTHGDLKKGELLAKTGLLIFAGLQDGFTYYGSSCMGLGLFYEKQGNPVKEEAYQQEAAKIFRMAFGEEHYIYARIALSLALIYEKQKKILQAEALIVHGKNVHEKVFGKDHIQYAGFSYELARFYVRQQQYATAAPFFREAATIKLNRVRDNFNNLSEKEKKDLFRTGNFYFENYAFCLLKLFEKDKTATRDLYNLIIDTKGLIYQSAAKTREKVLSSGNDQLIQLFTDLAAQRDNVAKVYSMSLEERKTKGIDLAKLETSVNALEKSMVRQASELNIEGLEEKKDIDWKQVKSKLQPDEAAIEIVRAERDGIREEAIYGALIITGQEQAEPDLVMLGSGTPMETNSIGYYNNAIRFQLNDTLSYNTFWKPLVAKLKGVKKIFFSPSGVYHQVSIAAIKNPMTGKFLMDEYDIHIVGNTKDILKERKSSGLDNTTYLIGFPDYTSDNFQPPKNIEKENKRGWRALDGMSQSKVRYFDASNGTVTPLPGTRAEVEAIAEMLKEKNIPVSFWIGKEATEERLKKIKQPAVLHIATHGFFLPNQHVVEKDEFAIKSQQDPMLRAGLLLADCENALRGLTGNIEKEDGILSAYEAMNLPLDQTDLVVLSACETGVGEIDCSEGVYGLLRAFQQAGARFILVSLWKVDDEATQLLMTAFYQFQLQGLTYSQAFNRARQVVSQKYPNPYYWGAFVLIGV